MNGWIRQWVKYNLLSGCYLEQQRKTRVAISFSNTIGPKKSLRLYLKWLRGSRRLLLAFHGYVSDLIASVASLCFSLFWTKNEN